MGFWGLNIKGKTTSYEKIKPILEKHCKNIIARDSVFVIPNDPEYIIKKSPALNMEWIKYRRDCEDMNRILRGWLSKKGFGNVLAIDTKVISGNEIHALIGFLVDKELQLWDAQSGKRWAKDCIILHFIL